MWVSGVRTLMPLDFSRLRRRRSTRSRQPVNVKIALLFRSPNATSDVTISKSYNLLGTTIASFGDKRSRRAVTVTVSLRNRPIKDIGGT